MSGQGLRADAAFLSELLLQDTLVLLLAGMDTTHHNTAADTTTPIFMKFRF